MEIKAVKALNDNAFLNEETRGASSAAPAVGSCCFRGPRKGGPVELCTHYSCDVNSASNAAAAAPVSSARKGEALATSGDQGYKAP